MTCERIRKNTEGKQQPESESDRGPQSSKRASLEPLQQLQDALGNQAFGKFIQAKLKFSQPGDVYEQEADRVADRVMRMPDAATEQAAVSRLVSPSQLQRACSKCEDEDKEKLQLKAADQSEIKLQAKAPAGETFRVTPAIEAPIDLGTGGEPLPASTRAYFEPRFGYDFSHLRVHTDARAAESARAVNALAFTIGSNLVFGAGHYAPESYEGRRLIAHELAHTVQQSETRGRAEQEQHGVGESQLGKLSVRRNAAAQVLPIRERVEPTLIARALDPSMCASDCEIVDGTEGSQSDYTLTIHTDKEGPFLLIPLTHDVGHSWIKLTDKDGNYWTYGFWPQMGFDPSHLTKDVSGCVHHPDTAHTPSASQTFKLTEVQFNSAKAKAISICRAAPDYNLFGLQCTSFVRQVLQAAGKAPALGFSLIWDSPNALHSWIKSNAFVLGMSYTAATSAPEGAGAFGLDISYTHQFYSALGEKLRFHWISRGELSSRMATLSTGIGAEVTSQRVFLPSAYVFGGGIMGAMTPNMTGISSERFGAGLTLGTGLQYHVDQFMTIGVEHNLVKDFVNDDPHLNRLMLRAGLTF